MNIYPIMHRLGGLLLIIVSLSVDNLLAATYSKTLCHSPGFSCLRIKKSKQTWASLWPNPSERDLIMRINRMNIPLYPGLTLAIPKTSPLQNIMEYAPFAKQIDSMKEKLLVFDPNQHAWAAYDATGHLIRWGPASGGADWCKDIEKPCTTSAGTFRIFSVGGSDCISHKFPLPNGGAPMPYCMYFSHGQAFHGEPRGLPGYHASHGCIRLYGNDAEWLRYDFIEPPTLSNHYRGTIVEIKKSEAAPKADIPSHSPA